MRMILILSLLSASAFAGENKANNNSSDYCSKIVDTRPAKSCAVKVCKVGLVCDFDCMTTHAGDDVKWQKCRTACWDATIERMKGCG